MRVKKKILFLTNCPSPYRVDFFNQLGTQDGIELTVVFTQRPEGHKGREARWFGIDYSGFNAVFCSVRKKVIKGKVYYPEVLEWVKKDFDEIIFGGYADISFACAMIYLKRRHRSFSLEVDGGLIKQDSKLAFWIKHKLISCADRWISSGKATDDYLLHYGAKREKIVHYPFTSLSKHDFEMAADQIEHKQACRNRVGYVAGIYVLFVGQFIHRKGLDILLKAAVQLPRSINFVLIGGEPTEDMIGFCKANHLDNFIFPGFKSKSELVDYYAASDLFVLPTRNDVWGLVVNEAMAYGLPVITTDQCVAGVELVENGKNGYVVPVDDADAIAKAVTDLLTNHEAMQGGHSLNKIQEYSIENMVKAHIQMWEE